MAFAIVGLLGGLFGALFVTMNRYGMLAIRALGKREEKKFSERGREGKKKERKRIEGREIDEERAREREG